MNTRRAAGQPVTIGPVKHMLKPHPNSVSKIQFFPGKYPELQLHVRTQIILHYIDISPDGLKV